MSWGLGDFFYGRTIHWYVGLQRCGRRVLLKSFAVHSGNSPGVLREHSHIADTVFLGCVQTFVMTLTTSNLHLNGRWNTQNRAHKVPNIFSTIIHFVLCCVLVFLRACDFIKCFYKGNASSPIRTKGVGSSLRFCDCTSLKSHFVFASQTRCLNEYLHS